MHNSPISIAQHYHERTKYSPESIAANSPLDWANQPIPFKDYKIGTAAVDLRPYLNQPPDPHDPKQQFLRRLSRFFFYSYGLTLKVVMQNGEPFYFRAAPSAGGLYPAELYLISRGTPFLPIGLYHYQSPTHSLLQFWDSDVWNGLRQSCFWYPTLDDVQLAVVVTAVFHRSAWRYHDRAYRRVFLDSGHVLGNIELAGALTDYRPHLIGGFADNAVNDLLYLDADKEGAIAIMALADRLELRENLPLQPTALPSVTTTNYPKIPDGELLSYLHQATRIPSSELTVAKLALPKVEAEDNAEDKYNFPFCLKVPMKTKPIPWGNELSGLETTILKRRSTREYSGLPLSLSDLQQVLDFTYHPEHYVEQGFDPIPDYCDLELIQTFIAISGVDGLDEGCYYYAPKAQELRQIRFKNFRRELHELCLGQNLGRDAGAVVFHTADLSQAVAKYGDRVYRYLHMDAGHLGQRLNLAAIYLGLGVSGIGGFFDDDVNEVLGIPADEAVLYITTLGKPRG